MHVIYRTFMTAIGVAVTCAGMLVIHHTVTYLFKEGYRKHKFQFHISHDGKPD